MPPAIAAELDGRKGARARRLGRDEVVRHVDERAEDAVDVLVAHDAEHDDQRREREGLDGGVDRSHDRRRVVGGVEDDGRGGTDALQACGGDHVAEPGDDDLRLDRAVAVQRLDRGEGDGRVLSHVGPVHGQDHVVDPAAARVETQHLSADARRPVEDGEVDALGDDPYARLGGCAP